MRLLEVKDSSNVKEKRELIDRPVLEKEKINDNKEENTKLEYDILVWINNASILKNASISIKI